MTIFNARDAVECVVEDLFLAATLSPRIRSETPSPLAETAALLGLDPLDFQ